MAFTVRDFESLIRLLDRHPEWLEALRQRILTRELMEMPAALQAFRVETERRFQRVEEQIAELAEAQRRHYEEFAAHRQEFLAYRQETDRRFAELREELATHRAETDRRFAELAEAQRRHYEEFATYRAETDRRFAELAEALRRLTERVEILDGRVRGWEYEDRYRTRPRRYRHLVRDPHILSVEERESLLRSLEIEGRLTTEEADELGEADVLVRGRRREGEGDAYLVIEVSAMVHTEDVERAAERAAALQRALPEAEVLAVVAGPEIHPMAAALARGQGVWWLKDGRVFAPSEIPGSSPGM
ncbi:MAG: hypothetical protein RMM07_05430 [Anaerolineae bacterium]|nr:hypothetical protein [Anaerolineae bacterium]